MPTTAVVTLSFLNLCFIYLGNVTSLSLFHPQEAKNQTRLPSSPLLRRLPPSLPFSTTCFLMYSKRRPNEGSNRHS